MPIGFTILCQLQNSSSSTLASSTYIPSSPSNATRASSGHLLSFESPSAYPSLHKTKFYILGFHSSSNEGSPSHHWLILLCIKKPIRTLDETILVGMHWSNSYLILKIPKHWWSTLHDQPNGWNNLHWSTRVSSLLIKYMVCAELCIPNFQLWVCPRLHYYFLKPSIL